MKGAVEQVRVPKNIEFKKQVSEDLNVVNIDPVKIKRIVENLINNSIEAMPEGGRIALSVNRSKGGLEIKVKDNGVGISQEVQDVLFSKMVTTKPNGTGLGLPFCKMATEKHGGNIDIDSTTGKGTTVKVFIPLWTPSDPNDNIVELIS